MSESQIGPLAWTVGIVVAVAVYVILRGRTESRLLAWVGGRRANAAGFSGMLGVSVAAGAGGDWRLSLFLAVGAVAVVAVLWVESIPSKKAAEPPRDRPDFVPSWWRDEGTNRAATKTPLRALIFFAALGSMAAALLFWRIVGPASFETALGESGSATLPIVRPFALGFARIFGGRALAAHRRQAKPRRDRQD